MKKIPNEMYRMCFLKRRYGIFALVIQETRNYNEYDPIASKIIKHESMHTKKKIH